MTDLATIKTTDRTIEMIHPASGERVGVRVNIVSIDDERLMKVKREITDRRLYLEARGKSFKSEDIEQNKNNILFAAMTGWEWYNPTGKEDDEGFDPDAQAVFNGTIPDFTKRNVVDVFKVIPWFSDQINEGIGETKSFFDNSKPN
jgi:hypothetical protein